MLIRDEEGFIITNGSIPSEYVASNYYELDISGDHYYYKKITDKDEVYNEMLAEEFAKDMGIPVCYNDIVVNSGIYGNISKSERENYDSYMTIFDLSKKLGLDFNTSNTLEDIWDMFYYEYKNPYIVKSLMDQLVKIFIYDALIVNPDRHCVNLAIVSKDGVPSFYPLYDNGMMCTRGSIEIEDYELSPDGAKPYYQFQRFVGTSASMYEDEIRKSLNVITPENITSVFNRVENKIHAKIPMEVKEHVYSVLSLNYEHINDVFNEDVHRSR